MTRTGKFQKQVIKKKKKEAKNSWHVCTHFGIYLYSKKWNVFVMFLDSSWFLRLGWGNDQKGITFVEQHFLFHDPVYCYQYIYVISLSLPDSTNCHWWLQGCLLIPFALHYIEILGNVVDCLAVARLPERSPGRVHQTVEWEGQAVP